MYLTFLHTGYGAEKKGTKFGISDRDFLILHLCVCVYKSMGVGVGFK